MSSRSHRKRRRRRQDLTSLLLCSILAGLHTWLLYGVHPELPRRRQRAPVAVALVSTQQRRLLPTPSMLPTPPSLKASRRAIAAEPAAPAPAAATSKAAARKRAPDGDRPSSRPAKEDKPGKKDKPAEETAVAEGAEEQEGAESADGVKEDAPEAEAEEIAVQVGGRRSCAADGPGAPAAAAWSSHPLQRPAWPKSLLLPFKTRPDLGGYLGGLEVLGRVGPRALGTFRVALPEDVIRVELDEPSGAALYVGRTDARCVVLATLRANPLQIKLRGVPLRTVDRARRVASAVVDLTVDEDARIVLVKRAGDELPFTRARLANGGAVAASLNGHIKLARIGR